MRGQLRPPPAARRPSRGRSAGGARRTGASRVPPRPARPGRARAAPGAPAPMITAYSWPALSTYSTSTRPARASARARPVTTGAASGAAGPPGAVACPGACSRRLSRRPAQPLPQLLLKRVLAAAERLHGRAAEPGPFRLGRRHAQRGPQVREALIRRREHRPDAQRGGPVALGGAEHPLRGALGDGQGHAEGGELRHLGGDQDPELGGAEHRPLALGGGEPGGHGRGGAAPVAGLRRAAGPGRARPGPAGQAARTAAPGRPPPAAPSRGPAVPGRWRSARSAGGCPGPRSTTRGRRAAARRSARAAAAAAIARRPPRRRIPPRTGPRRPSRRGAGGRSRAARRRRSRWPGRARRPTAGPGRAAAGPRRGRRPARPGTVRRPPRPPSAAPRRPGRRTAAPPPGPVSSGASGTPALRYSLGGAVERGEGGGDVAAPALDDAEVPARARLRPRQLQRREQELGADDVARGPAQVLPGRRKAWPGCCAAGPPRAGRGAARARAAPPRRPTGRRRAGRSAGG